MNFSAWSIRNPVPAILLFVLLTVIGLIGFGKLQVQDFPDMDLPTIQIQASLEGAAPSQLETEVARKIEDKLASLSQLDHITTTITDGAVSISVSFDIEKNAEEALNEVRNAVDGAKADLPASMAAPTVSKLTTASSALLSFTIESDRLDEQALSWLVDNEVAKAMLAVKGVGSVARVGGVDREVHIDLQPALMAGLGVTASDVSAQLKAVQKESSGGQGDLGGERQSVRTLATVERPQDLGAVSLPLADGRRVRLDQIARVTDSHAERSTLALRDGRPVIGFQVTRSRGFSDVGVARAVRQAVATFAQTHPNVRINEAFNTVDPIEDNYHGSMQLLIEGALLAVVVVWWFLRDWRATLVSAAALPLSIVPAFLAMWLLGYSLNTVTLLSLSLVVGVLVDDAIVEIENIERHLLMGKRPYEAAMEAADEIGLAVIATTFTLVAVFLPTAFMGGIPGKFFRQFGITASVAVLASLLVARLLTPMMAAYLLKPKRVPMGTGDGSGAGPDARAGHGAGPADGPLMTRYLGWVRSSLRARKRTVAGVLVFMVMSLAVVPFIPTAFMPAQDKAQSTVSLKMAPGTTLEMTAETSRRAAELLSGMAEVRSVFIAAGEASTGGGMGGATLADLTSATLTVDLVPRSERDMKQSEVEAQMRQLLRSIPGARISVGSNGNGESLQLTLASDDPEALTRAATQAEAQLRTLQGIGNVTSSASLQRPEIQIRPDSARAAALGVTTQSLADAVRLATYGDYSQALPKLNLPQRQINVRVRLDEQVRRDLDAVGQLRVAGAHGTVSLSSVADLSLGSGPSQIDRIDRSRNVTLTVELNGRAIGDVQREALALPALRTLPAGVHFVDQGELQRMAELFQSFGLAMAIGIFCIYAVLVLLFHDFLQPATILCALPLALGGALMALWMTSQSFSMPVVIGVLMLMGIVTKNSILLVEYAIVARRLQGLSRLDAIVDACHKRARPIVMTTIAMGAGMMPNALGLGAEPSFRQPMAIVVIGGLITSTALSLLVVPVVFTYVDDLLIWLRAKVRPARAGGPVGAAASGDLGAGRL
ncbi:efflux RND transporter permease subunit [Roseateles amylovorans]|uniref:Efflux RND transporter permease subunit n=1 Tax=Roseateles amylovorans TaxID=2978473 RepID=A0ABY6AZA2_9BURK|nr:efflux RND transporter permease subunit [Roseateles amylovorans]UXH77226.1 efflux RND transporter permease subunit [Roseateles amylovorans]